MDAISKTIGQPWESNMQIRSKPTPHKPFATWTLVTLSSLLAMLCIAPAVVAQDSNYTNVTVILNILGQDIDVVAAVDSLSNCTKTCVIIAAKLLFPPTINSISNMCTTTNNSTSVVDTMTNCATTSTCPTNETLLVSVFPQICFGVQAALTSLLITSPSNAILSTLLGSTSQSTIPTETPTIVITTQNLITSGAATIHSLLKNVSAATATVAIMWSVGLMFLLLG
ncbi:hypothetical protein HDU97_001870 [Phlyctochytrium planicorne]|nr:hypothetical protein HDU97_001870 [Phlyctochytrium planicorne]